MKITIPDALRRILSTAAVLAGVTGLAAAHDQEATELFIPIGQSPGMSSITTDIAEIAAVNSRLETVTLVEDGGTWSVAVSKRTRIWLDRSGHGLTNLSGGMEDLREGMVAEIKYADPTRRQLADWIKVAPVTTH